MASLRNIGQGLYSLFRRRRVERELAEEIDEFLQLAAEAKIRQGASSAEAQREVRLERGSSAAAREDVWTAGWEYGPASWAQDVRFAGRVLRRTPGFTIVAVVTLALAIAANLVVFGMLNALILRPLNLPRAESLFGLEHANEANMWESYPDYRDLRDRNRSFADLAGFAIDQVGLDADAESSPAWAEAVTGNFFDVLGVQPYRGRFFHASDEHGPDSAPYVVLGFAYWKSRFHGDEGVIGSEVRVNKHPFTIIGVAPPKFHGVLLLAAPDCYVPIVNQSQVEGRNTLTQRSTHSLFMVFGHLKTGVTPAAAAADLDSVGAWLAKTYPTDHGTTSFVLARPGLYGDLLRGPARAFLSGLLLLSGLILLAACANLGSLFAARAADRSREIALRLALGASRIRVLRQLLTEAVLVSLAGGAVGLWGGSALLHALSVWYPFPRFPVQVAVEPDGRVYVFAIVLAFVSGLLFGLAAVRFVLRSDASPALKAGSAGTAPGRFFGRELLLAIQISICAILVTASLVATRGLLRSLHSNFGFDPDHVLVVETDLTMAGYSAAAVPPAQRRLIDGVSGVPDVRAAALIGRLPLSGGGFGSAIYRDTAVDFRPANAAATATRFQVSPDYFRAAGTVLLAGREFTWHDDVQAPRVAVINREFARRIFGSVRAAVGGHFKLRDDTRVLVVGVAEDGKYESLTETPEAALWVPILQMPMSECCLVIRTAGDPREIAAAVRARVRSIDAGLPVLIQSWNGLLDLPLFPSRVAATALAVLGGIGALLAVTGIFGLASYSVSRRKRELGIRIALGAERREVLNAALGRAMRLLAWGSAAGLLLGLLASRVLAVIVYEATPRDPIVLAGAILGMALIGVIAAWIPAQRALKLDPLVLLREE